MEVFGAGVIAGDSLYVFFTSTLESSGEVTRICNLPAAPQGAHAECLYGNKASRVNRLA